MAAPDPSDEAAGVRFDPTLDLSPYALFRRLTEGRPPFLVDVRPAAGAAQRRSLSGAVRAGSDAALGGSLTTEAEIVLFDDDGNLARAAARRLQEAGFHRTRALYGGLALYEFALDPGVVGPERFLVQDDS